MKAWDERALLATIDGYWVARQEFLGKLTMSEFLSGSDYKYPGLTESQTNILQIGLEIEKMHPRKRIIQLARILSSAENMGCISAWCAELALTGKRFRKAWRRCSEMAMEMRDKRMNAYVRLADDYATRGGIYRAIETFNRHNLKPICP